MTRRFLFACLAVMTLFPLAPAQAGAGAFTLVNGTDGPLRSIRIKRTGTSEWRPLAVSPEAFARAAVDFHDDDCAFDISAEVPPGTSVVWQGVNLCGAKVVTLNRNGSAAWVDYD
jgi:hypothetical protein